MVLDDLDALPVIVGHSMGGLTVQKYLDSHEVIAAVFLTPVPASAV
jgi:alpha-beta hydrolase superfamily lysophospholipase